MSGRAGFVRFTPRTALEGVIDYWQFSVEPYSLDEALNIATTNRRNRRAKVGKIRLKSDVPEQALNGSPTAQ